MASSTPVIVTVWGAFQLVVVKATLAGLTVPSEVSELLRAIVTPLVGSEFSTIVNVACPPASVVVKPEMGSTVIPALSSSVLDTDTLDASRPL